MIISGIIEGAKDGKGRGRQVLVQYFSLKQGQGLIYYRSYSAYDKSESYR
jgi:hypothetical protein